MAQACLESNYGQSGLATKGKNLFGVKGSYQGQSVNMDTTEYKNGEPYRTNAKFKQYSSWYESLEDLCLLYCNGVSWDRSKYHSIIGESNYEEAAKKVQAAGYATDPHYADKLIQVIVRNRLDQYDQTTAEPAKTPSMYRFRKGTDLMDTGVPTIMYDLLSKGYVLTSPASNPGITKGKSRYINSDGQIVDTDDNRVKNNLINKGYKFLVKA
jgi:hypothetical protein